MRAPTADDRQSLDEAIAVLVRLGDDVTLEDFRAANMAAVQRTNQRLRVITVYGCLAFLLLTFWAMSQQATGAPRDNLTNSIWGFSLGGLGAVASLFVLLLRLAPEEPFKITNEFDAVGRIVLGCVFSSILTMTLPPELNRPVAAAGKNKDVLTAIAVTLAPFLFGYSTELALRILDRAVQTLLIFFGADDRRQSPQRRTPRRRARAGP